MVLPSFYDPSRIGHLFKPDLYEAFSAGLDYGKRHGIPSSASDTKANVILCLIDMQVDFINPADSNYPGSLCVPGAVGDVKRVCDFIFNNAANITSIVASLDTHYLFQPFHRCNWEAGSNHDYGYQEHDHPKPFTVITRSHVKNDVWRPTRRFKTMELMLEKLDAGARQPLMIWPFHCILGSPGHALDQTLLQTIYWHSGVRRSQYNLTEKGMSQSSEHYGILKAEVEFADDPSTSLNMRMVETWSRADRVYVAGEARTHCCLQTLNQIEEELSNIDQSMLKKLHVLSDCMSNVPDPVDADGNVIVPFDKITTKRFKELESRGFNFVKSTDPVSL